MKCCNIEIYTKVKQYARPLTLPLTPDDALRDKLVDLTGESYLVLPHKFCPFCGKELGREDDDSGN